MIGQINRSLQTTPFCSKKRVYTFLLTVLIFFLFVLPIIRLFSLSFFSDGAFTFANYTAIFAEARTWRILENTFVMVLGSTLLAIGLGLFFAWVVAYSDIRGKKLMQLFILIPFIIPSYIITLSWTQFMGTNGLAGSFLSVFSIDKHPFNLYSMSGMIFILGLSHFPLVFLFTVNVLRKIPRDMEWAARASGASSRDVFRKITLPLALPGLAGGGLLALCCLRTIECKEQLETASF